MAPTRLLALAAAAPALLSLSAEGATLYLEYALRDQNVPKDDNALSWALLGTMEMSLAEGYGSLNLVDGNVLGSIPGDAVSLADDIWDKSGTDDALVIRARVDNDTAKTGKYTINMSRLPSKRTLAKIFSNSEVEVLVGRDGTLISTAYSVPWTDLKRMETSRRRIGLVALHKPVHPSYVFEGTLPGRIPPRAKSATVEDEVAKGAAADQILTLEDSDPNAGRPKEPEKGFFARYWWVILVGVVMSQMMSKKEDPVPTPHGAPNRAGAGGPTQNRAAATAGQPNRRR